MHGNAWHETTILIFHCLSKGESMYGNPKYLGINISAEFVREFELEKALNSH